MATKKYVLVFIAIIANFLAFAETYKVVSPDGKIEAQISDGEKLLFSVKADGATLIEPFEIAMLTDRATLGGKCKIKTSIRTSNDSHINTVWGIRAKVADKYNMIELGFGKWKLFVRAYDDCVAYRFSTLFDGDMIVRDEIFNLPIKSSDIVIAQPAKEQHFAYETEYRRMKIADIEKIHSVGLPVIIDSGKGAKVAVVESDIVSYPALRIAAGKGKAHARLSKFPKKFTGTQMLKASEFYDYIAKTSAKRDFPWRAFVLARRDADFADSDAVYKLARPQAFADSSWITVGNCVWDWCVNWNIENAGFETGVNLQNYQYYVDFAAENNIPYILIDAGWIVGRDNKQAAADHSRIMQKPYLDMTAVCDYAHSKGVKVIAWTFSRTLDIYAEKAFDIIKSYGIDGVKPDFEERDDQLAVEFYERIARIAAERQMVVDFHGCAKPAGLGRTYPNVLNFEAVRGGEMNKFNKTITPSHNIDLIFTRMLQGPMDYTPGFMRNRTQKEYQQSYDQPPAMGTRCHQLAMYAMYFAPLQMLSDMPTEYKKYPDILKLISQMPTSWDETKALDGKIGEYAIIARRKGEVWYIGGMADWNGKKATINLAEFLPNNSEYEAEIFRDTVNSNKLAIDYAHESKSVKSSDNIELEMKNGGGFVVKLTPQKGMLEFIGL